MKRMIDNKEFDALKKDVSDISEKVDELKGIPTITIDVSQMLSETEAQLTEEQFEILSSNNYVNIVLPTEEYFPLVNSARNELITIFNGVISYDSDLDVNYYYSVSVVNSTLVATFGTQRIDTGKKLYQHNFYFRNEVSYARGVIQIISDNETPMTINDVRDWLYNNGYENPSDYWTIVSNCYGCYGAISEGGVLKSFFGVHSNGTNVWASCIAPNGTIGNLQINVANFIYNDTIIAL